jgi:hypothetical protein
LVDNQLEDWKAPQVDNQPEDTKAPQYHEKLFDRWVPVTFSRSFQMIFAKELKQNQSFKIFFGPRIGLCRKEDKKRDGACLYAGGSHRMLQYQLVIKK